MRRLLTLAFALSAVAANAAVLKVITTTQDLASIAKAVGGSYASVSPLVVGARDPHRLDAKPSYMSRLASADLYIAIGLDMEIGYESAILTGSRNSKVQEGGRGHVHAGDWVPVLEKPAGAVTRAHGDLHPYGNPHIWLDPYNGRIIALKLAEKMAGLNPGNAGAYRANAKAFVDKLDDKMFGAALVNKFGADKLWTWIRGKQLLNNVKEAGASSLLGGWVGRMAPFVNSNVVTYHRSLSYFINRFGLQSSGELEPKPGIDPTPSHLSRIITIIKRDNVKAIVQEPFYSQRNAKFVAARTGAKVVVIPGNVGHMKGVDDYFDLFDVITSRLAAEMR